MKRSVATLFLTAALVGAATAAAAVSPTTPLERTWLRELATNHQPHLSSRRAALSVRSQIAESVKPRALAQPVVRIYAAFGSLAPDVRVTTSNAALYLRHDLTATLRLARGYLYAHIAVIDRHGVALDWYQLPGGGALSLRPDVAGCSPIQPAGGRTAHACPVS